jgi:hypothetical protein
MKPRMNASCHGLVMEDVCSTLKLSSRKESHQVIHTSRYIVCITSGDTYTMVANQMECAHLPKREEKETGRPTKQKKKNKRLSVANPDAAA